MDKINDMEFSSTNLNGTYIVTLDPYSDERGSFTRLFCVEEFKKIGHEKPFVQVNHSLNLKKGTFRGLHYQLQPFTETKLVGCVLGSALDIIIDIRKGSDTFLQHFSLELSAQKNKMIYIPEGFAHGFITLEDNTQLIYFHTAYHQTGYEAGLNWNDPLLNLNLPIEPRVISEKDKGYDLISTTFEGI